MSKKPHSFKDIFGQSFECDGQSVELKKIVIPIIQRDYAQGREGLAAARIRERFLHSLYEAVTKAPIALDFVYGDIDENGVMTPLDGQQRLTTLFLLHWYAAKIGNLPEEECEFLNNFTYETRYSARDFCEALAAFTPTFTARPGEEIADQPWFPLDWKKDPTIRGMLVMLDAIEDKFSGIKDLWSRLTGSAVTFYFLPIKEMGLTDELYIKMNSRGKPLTAFEHFKAEFERELKSIDAGTAERIIKKIDIDWTEMLWRYRGDNNITDDEFLNYFKFICDMIRYKNGGTPQGKSSDEFDLIDECFGREVPDVQENIQVLEECFDCWDSLSMPPKEFCEKFMSYDHEAGKIRIDKRNDIDIFGDCLANYGLLTGKNRKFPLNRYVLLYAVVTYLRNNLKKADKISEDDFARRLRIVNNLINNSRDEVSDSESRVGGNRMPMILKQVDSIIVNGEISTKLDINFNDFQLAEEREKLAWTEKNPGKANALFELEDHDLLFGQISIVGLENSDLFQRFQKLFKCSRDAIDCALLVMGDYSQRERNGWRYQIGSSAGGSDAAWVSLFHKSAASGIEKTKEALIALLQKTDNIDDEYLYGLCGDYMKKCEDEALFDWKYYYVGYKEFRPGRYGKIYWVNKEEQPYEFYLLWTELYTSSNAYNPFLGILDWDSLSRDDLGQLIIVGDTYLKCETDAYVLYKIYTENELERFDIPQNEEGIDTVNRIEAVKSWYEKIKKKYA